MFYRFIVASLLSVSLVACGSGSGGRSNGPSDPPPPSTPDPDPSPTPDPDPDPDPAPDPIEEPVPEPAPAPADITSEVNCVTEHASTADTSIPLPPFAEGSMPDHSGNMMKEHMAALDLVDYSDATHVAVASGDWCDPKTWHNSQVPGTEARAVIPENLTVTYGSVSDAELTTLRVDGELAFSTTAISQLKVDTMFIDPRGQLTIGTKTNPMSHDARVVITFLDNGPIDTNWDPLLLSRGMIAHGVTEIHGQPKTAHIKVKEDPAAGTSTLVLAGTPENWKEGDQLLVTGTYYSGWKWDQAAQAEIYFGTQDEFRSISEINGNIVTLSEPLTFDHFTPRQDLHPNIVNVTRNVTFKTENPKELPSHQRGHVMFMHSDKADIRYASFWNLGRTDKSKPSFEVHDLETVSADTNVRGRYPFHFHRTGMNNPRDPATAIGNVVIESPGWGFVHHDSHANFYENASFNTFGAGFVSETGNETGDWIRNIAVRAKGTATYNPKNDTDVINYDIARTGDGFWFQSRMVRSFDNIASSVNHGFVYFHRGTGVIKFPATQYMLPEALGYGDPAAPDDVPIRAFDDNEAYAVQVGLWVVKAGPQQEHDIFTVLSNFTAWEAEAGAAVEYTSHYLFDNFDLIGNTPEPFRKPIVGIELGNNSSDMVVRNSTISGFTDGMHLSKTHTEDRWLGKDQYVLIDNNIQGATTPYVHLDSSDLFIAASDLVPNRFSVTLDNDDPFEYTSASTEFGSGVSYAGRKQDSIGTSPLPAGVDSLITPVMDMIGHLEKEGYYTTSGGDTYTIIESYFSDRATGRIHKMALPTRLGQEVVNAINSSQGSWNGAKYIGTIDLQSRPPVAVADEAYTSFGMDIVVDVLKNDSDPDGDSLSIDGIVQPRHGVVFENGDGSIVYRPNIGFSGEDTVQFWISDRQGNFTESELKVHVAGN